MIKRMGRLICLSVVAIIFQSFGAVYTNHNVLADDNFTIATGAGPVEGLSHLPPMLDSIPVLWPSAPGIQQHGNIHIDGTVTASGFVGNGFGLTGINGSGGGGAGDGHSLDAADGSPIDIVSVDNTGNVNIGPAAVVTNNGVDFNTEGNYVQEDATNGTDFIGGVVKLHETVSLSSGNDANTVLLIHSDTTNGSVTFTDSAAGSSPAKAITAFGNIQHSTALSKFGTSSILLDGTGDYLQTPSHTDLNFASSFTVDTWFRFSSLADTVQTIFSSAEIGGYGIVVRLQGSNIALYLTSVAGVWNISNGILGTKTFVINQWYHLTLVWDGATYKLYIDGLLDITVTSATAILSSNPFYIGIQGGPLFEPFVGNIDEFRFSKGIARWTANFTPPTASYTAATYPTAQPYYITTSVGSQIGTAGWADINSITPTQITPASTSIKYLVSFDGRLTWKAWNGTSWIASSLANLQIDGMTKTAMEGITQAQWKSTGGFVPGITVTLDFVADLLTTDSSVTPSLDQIAVQYSASNLGTLYIDFTSGNVGIGTVAPAGKLDVDGTIFQRGIQLHADYVFELDYNLESISEHAEFMWSNKHLKSIPKARVDEKGREIVEVGAHRKGIVEELEKAHIYIDQLHQRIEEMELSLTQLKEDISKQKEM